MPAAAPPRNATRPRETAVPKDELKAAADAAVADCRSLLVEALNEAGLTQAKLSERLDVTRSNMAQMLGRGDGNPTIRTVASWLYALGYRLVLDFESLDGDD